MKHYFYLSFIACFLLLAGTSHAQNLIPNGDFELGPDSSSGGWTDLLDSSCTVIGNMAGPDDWIVVSGTPDRIIESDVDTCMLDNDSAASGKAYCDFGVFGSNQYTEAGKATLLISLQKDSLYKLSYFISAQKYSHSWSPVPVGSVRIAFVFNNGGDSIVSSNTTFPFQWIHYDTTFTATSNATTIELRAVGDTNGNDTIWGGVNVDAISLEKVSSSGMPNLNMRSLFNLYPNPVNTELYLSTDEKLFSIGIYNALGQVVKIKELKISSGLFAMDVSKLSAGLYVVKAVTINNKTSIKKFIKLN